MTLLLVALATLAVVLYLGRDALGPFVLGLFLVYLLDPLVTWMNVRVRLPRSLGILLIYAAVVLIIIAVIRITIPPLVDQVGRLIHGIPAFVQSTIGWLEQLISDLDLLPTALRRELITGLEDLSTSITSGGGRVTIDVNAVLAWLNPGQVAGPFARVISAIFAYLVIPIFVFYLLKDRPALTTTFAGALPSGWRPDVAAVASIADRVFGRWLRGQLLLGITVGLATFVGLEVLGAAVNPIFRDFAIFLAITAGLFELLPIIGPIISAIPAVIIGATVGVEGAVAAFLLYLGVQQVENNLLVPKIQGDATDLHPGIVVAAIVIGGAIGGFLGAILALPVTATARDVVRYLMRRLDPIPVDVETALAEALRPGSWRAAAGGAGAGPGMSAAAGAHPDTTAPVGRALDAGSMEDEPASRPGAPDPDGG